MISERRRLDTTHREGGLNNAEIGRLLGVDYSTVSQGRKTLRDRLRKDKKAKEIVTCIEGKLSQIKDATPLTPLNEFEYLFQNSLLKCIM